MKSAKWRFQIDQFQGSPSLRNASALASKNRRRLASHFICLLKSLDSAMLLSTVRTNRLGCQSSSPTGWESSGHRSHRYFGSEADEETGSTSVSAILATCSELQKQTGSSGCESSVETVWEARIRTAFLDSRQPWVVQWTPRSCPGSQVRIRPPSHSTTANFGGLAGRIGRTLLVLGSAP